MHRACHDARVKSGPLQSPLRYPGGGALNPEAGLLCIQIPFSTGTITSADSKGERGFEEAFYKRPISLTDQTALKEQHFDELSVKEPETYGLNSP